MRRLGLALGGLVVLMASLFVVAAGCGDGEDGEVPLEPRERLSRMVLQAEDLPAAFSAISEVFSTNQEVADESPDPEEQLAKLQQWGRVLGYDVTYEPSGAATEEQVIVFSVNSTATIYTSAEGASASFAAAAEVTKDINWDDFFGGAVDITVEEMPAPAVVDEILWLRVRGRADVGEQTFAHDIVFLREGASRGSLQAASFGSEGGEEFVERLIRAQAAHMTEAAP